MMIPISLARTLHGVVRESFVTMMPAFKFKSCALAATLLVLSIGSQALTLGRARGAAIVGKPLSLSVPISAASDESLVDLCFEADVFYGDNKVDGSKVTLTSDPAVAGQTWQVRVVSSLPVDEPVVTLNLRSACSAKASRRFVILADVAVEAPLVIGGANQPFAGAAKPEGQIPVETFPTTNLGRFPSASNSNSRAEEKPKSQRNVRAASKESAAVSNGELKRAQANKARLKLAPLDLYPERDPLLKTSPELLSSPTDDIQKRVEAAALWRALNLTPDDVLRDATRLQLLEKNVQKLTDSSGINQRQINDLLARLERAEGERYRNPLVFGLGAIILLLAAGGAWLVLRQRYQTEGSPWWRAEPNSEDGPESVPGAGERVATSLEQLGGSLGGLGVNRQVAPSVESATGAVDIDLELDFSSLDQSDIDVKAEATGASSKNSLDGAGHKDFSHSLSAGLRAVNTQEMLDIRQQAEFFMTLGQYDDAIALLEGHVADSVEFNPSIYLDLLKIFHTLSRKEEFDRYRSEFNAVFSGQVPGYADFLQVGKDLEEYPDLCTELIRLWPSREALEFLESCLVRQPGVNSRVLVDLEAFKELLLLHAIGSRLVGALDGAPATFSPSKSLAQELQVFHTGPAPINVTLPMIAAGSLVEVDLELDMPDLVPATAIEPAGNLIDFDVSGFSIDNAKVD